MILFSGAEAHDLLGRVFARLKPCASTVARTASGDWTTERQELDGDCFLRG